MPAGNDIFSVRAFSGLYIFTIIVLGMWVGGEATTDMCFEARVLITAKIHGVPPSPGSQQRTVPLKQGLIPASRLQTP